MDNVQDDLERFIAQQLERQQELQYELNGIKFATRQAKTALAAVSHITGRMTEQAE